MKLDLVIEECAIAYDRALAADELAGAAAARKNGIVAYRLCNELAADDPMPTWESIVKRVLAKRPTEAEAG